MHLINTIELEPFNFADNEYDFPDRGRTEAPEAWHQFWVRCVSDKSLGHLIPVEKGSYNVDIATISDQDLTTIIKTIIENIGANDFEESVYTSCGGIVLIHNNKICIEPSCCGDLGDIRGWGGIFETAPGQWKKLWIGHPWIYYRRQDDMVEFSDYTDNEYKENAELAVMISVPEISLRQQWEKMNNVQINFEDRIKQILGKLEINNAESIAKIITGND